VVVVGGCGAGWWWWWWCSFCCWWWWCSFCWCRCGGSSHSSSRIFSQHSPSPNLATPPPPHALRSGPPSANPEAHKLYSNLAACYTKLGAYPEGLKAADRCIELAPDFAKGYSRKGALQFLTKEYSKALATYEQGLARDPDSAELRDGAARCVDAIGRLAAGDASEEELAERRAKAMEDPEVQGILRDPVMQNVLQDLQTDPRAAQHHLAHPDIRAKISKLVAAGVIQTR
jgi:stress-induced-phosphoprotein 1